MWHTLQWEAGIKVHDVLPVTTLRGKQMMPPADRIYDPGQGAKKDLTDTGDDFLAISPALRIMQLNVESLPAAKHEVIRPDVRDRHTSDMHHRLMPPPYGGGGITMKQHSKPKIINTLQPGLCRDNLLIA